jgi:hypothetical protein
MELWPREVWPSLMRFTDARGGPRLAAGRRASSRRARPSTPSPASPGTRPSPTHDGRARGCRRPPSGRRRGDGPTSSPAGRCNRYPWGDVFDPGRANLWATGRGRTVPVREYPRGATPNGIHQMTGNVWNGSTTRSRPSPAGPTRRSCPGSPPQDRRGRLQHVPGRRGDLPLRDRPARARPPSQRRVPLRGRGRPPPALP